MRQIDSVAKLPRRSRGNYQSRVLLAHRGRTVITIGLDRRGSRARPFLFAVGDTAQGATGYRIPASLTELRDLFTALDYVAQLSAIDSLGQDAVYACGDLDHPPRVEHQAAARYPRMAEARGREGRVLLAFVVDTSGLAEPASVRAVLTDGEEFTEAATEAVLGSRFAPGQLNGQPVRVRVLQWARFHF
jgi:TonB family protein